MPDERQQAIRDLVAVWMQHARSDLVIAKMVDNEEVAPEISTFHAQQTVEKALKALLIQAQAEFPRTHVIGVLIALCRDSGYVMSDDLEEAVTLTRYAVAARYPGEAEPVSREEAWQATVLADRVYLWAESQIRD